jgi:hypothetical protein
MPLPEFNSAGDLPPGVHRSRWSEFIERFRGVSAQRRRCTRTLQHIYDLAVATKHLRRFVVFGSYVTDKVEPHDVDVILVMDDDFRLSEAPVEVRGLFDHATAQARHGASIFWIKPSVLIGGDTVDEFIGHWQVKRDHSSRGIVEIVT